MAPNNILEYHNFNLSPFLDLTLQCFSCNLINMYLKSLTRKNVPKSLNCLFSVSVAGTEEYIQTIIHLNNNDPKDKTSSQVLICFLQMRKVSEQVGFPLNCIFPLKNYHAEIKLNAEVDMLILSALRKILDLANDRVNATGVAAANKSANNVNRT